MNEAQSPNYLKAASRYGIYLGILLILIQTIQYLAGLHVSAVFTILTGSLFIAGVVLVIRDFRDKEMNGWLNFGEGVRVGSMSSLAAGFLYGAFMLALTMFIDPGFIEAFNLQQLEELENSPFKLTDEQMDKVIEAMEETSAWDFAISPVVVYSIFGFIISLIASIFLRKSPDNTFDKDTF